MEGGPMTSISCEHAPHCTCRSSSSGVQSRAQSPRRRRPVTARRPCPRHRGAVRPPPPWPAARLARRAAAAPATSTARRARGARGPSRA
eukprot:885291-Prymnesium_polylepis.1